MKIRFAFAAAVPLSLLAAAACVLSAADRAGRADSPFPALLSLPSLGPVAARRTSLAALRAADFPRAEALAKVAIARDPVQQQGTALLGAAQLGRHASEAAHQAFLVAGTLGWRDPITQLYWLDYAEKAGDSDMLAQRVDALFRTNNDSLASVALESLESGSQGQTSLAKRLALSPPWLANYTAGISSLASDQAIDGRIASLQRAKMAGMSTDCGIIASAARLLTSQKKQTRAASLWFKLCVPSSVTAGAMSDGGFDNIPIDRGPSPFEWKLESSGFVDVHTAPLPGSPTKSGLFARSSSSARELVAQKWIVLSPGRYALSWLAPVGGASASSPFSLSLGCPGAPAIAPPTPTPLGRGRYVFDIVVPQSGCPVQSLKIMIEPRSGIDGDLYISDLQISPEH